MNRDDQLSHTYDHFLGTSSSSSRRAKEPEELVPSSASDEAL